jgi:hypothetical protein
MGCWAVGRPALGNALPEQPRRPVLLAVPANCQLLTAKREQGTDCLRPKKSAARSTQSLLLASQKHNPGNASARDIVSVSAVRIRGCPWHIGTRSSPRARTNRS